MNLTADEITTFAEVFGHELTLAQMTHLEEWVDTHRDEAIVMHELRRPARGVW
jgi:DNA replication protein DnaD